VTLSASSSLGRRALVLCIMSAALAVAVSACGSSSSSSTASSSASAGAGAGAGAGGSSSATYEARLNYAKCMRAHGVNVPDPSANGGPAAGGGAGGAGFRSLRSSPNFTTASTACAKYRSKAFGFANISPAEQAKFTAELLKFAECMRAHSINVPDPTSSGAGGPFQIFRSIPSTERDSPAFEAATKACSSVLPRFGRGGAAGGGPAGGGPGA